MVNAAAVVYIFLEDVHKAVSMEDVKEWLQIVNDVVEIKLQFDAATERPCYYVEFRSATAAQQTVQYLSGARLKNCVVTIQSPMYSTAPEAQGPVSFPREPLSTTSAAPRPKSDPCSETEELPFNHLLPPDLQMDAPLAKWLPQLEKTALYSTDGFTMWQQLQEVQRELVEVYQELELTTEQVAASDTRLSELLHVKESESAFHGTILSHSPLPLRDRTATLQAYHVLSHQQAIPFDAHTPSRVVALLTNCFGPLSLCSEVVTQAGFFLAVRFVFAADEEVFLAAGTAPGSTEVSKENGQHHGAEWKSIVQGLDWRPAKSSTAVHHLFPLEVDARLQRVVRQLLT
ncbi:putative RNA recognition motif (RRM, RBD, or RNP domain) [Leishmania utingensis]|uniref:RNA recognition motif (RRM, RBD, or RNP domain) n=1 Tax=Leishmania utingensis TaxID=653362 RepID=A0AAW3ANZ6_9TRYP